MKHKEISITLILLLVILNIAGVSFDSDTLHYITFPFYQIGSLIRSLSQSGTVGNILSWIIYLLVISLPLLYLKFIKKETNKNDIILIIFNFCLVIFLYFWINPGYISTTTKIQGYANVVFVIFGCILYSLLLLYVLLELINKIKNSSELSILRIILGSLKAILYLLIFIVFGNLLSEFLSIHNQINEFDAQYGSKLFINIIQFLIKALPYLLSIYLVLKLHDFVLSHYRNPYSQESVQLLESTSTFSMKTLIITLISLLVYLVIVLFLLSSSNMTFTFTIPITPLLLMTSIILFNQLYRSNKALYDENQGFI